MNNEHVFSILINLNYNSSKKEVIFMSIYDISVRYLSNDKLDEYRGKVLLIVNTATKCGHTPQYEGLEALYKNLKIKGLKFLISHVISLCFRLELMRS